MCARTIYANLVSAIPCQYSITCSGADFPITNYSSEDPEQVPVFTSLVFPESWSKQGCLQLCTSTVSQEEADACALAQAAACNPPPVCVGERCFGGDGGGGGGEDGGGGGGTGTTPFYNTLQECTLECPDGTPFTKSVAAATFSATTQAAADARALAYACKLATDNLICVGDLTNSGVCIGELFTGIAEIQSVNPIALVSVTVGTLPDGISISNNNQSFTLSGIASVPGQYDFEVTVVDSLFNSVSKDFSLFVIEIAQTSPLPNGNVGNVYSQTLTVSGPTLGTVTWAVTAGALPDGLTLNTSTGEISGTPTVDATFNFTITVTDER